MGEGEGVVAVSAGHEYVGSTRGLGIVSSTADVLWMIVVSGMRGVGVVCEMCVFGSGRCVDKRTGFGLYQSCGNKWSVGRVSVFGSRRCKWGVLQLHHL